MIGELDVLSGGMTGSIFARSDGELDREASEFAKLLRNLRRGTSLAKVLPGVGESIGSTIDIYRVTTTKRRCICPIDDESIESIASSFFFDDTIG